MNSPAELYYNDISHAAEAMSMGELRDADSRVRSSLHIATRMMMREMSSDDPVGVKQTQMWFARAEMCMRLLRFIAQLSPSSMETGE